MSMILANANAKSASISAVITRADGTVVELGQIAYWHKNPLKRFAWNIKQFMKGIINGRSS